jgi:hypothetical protein
MSPPKPKKTGLAAEPLLLQRTDQVAEPQTEQFSAPPSQAAPRKNSNHPPLPARKPTKRNGGAYRAVPRTKVTLFIDEDVNAHLDLTARVEGKQRSEVATEILRKHMPRYRIEPE